MNDDRNDIPEHADKVATVRVEQETAQHLGWDFRVSVTPADGDETRHDVYLSWVDYEHWSHGRVPPELVVGTLVEELLGIDLPIRLPARFDASTARRWYPRMDELMRRRL